jgi:general nucleoside transport system permease protein
MKWFSNLPKSRRNLLIAVLAFVGLSLVRWASGENALTSQFTIAVTVTAAIPIAMAGLGAMMSERSGIINLGVEGMMILGTWFAGLFGFHWGAWAALAGGAIGGAIGGALHALATVTFGVDHTISGVALNTLAFGWTRFLSAAYFKGRGAGSETNSPGFNTGKTIVIPGLGGKGPLAVLEKRHWPIVSDICGVIRGLFAEWTFYRAVAFVLIPLVAFVIFRTKFGLRLRSSGEKPSAADSLGVQVNKIRYLAVMLSGALAGVGGAVLVLNNNGGYQEAQTANRGFLGIAAMIFGNWRPAGVAAGSLLFGFFDSLQLTSVGAVRGLYLAGVVAALVGGYVALRRHSPRLLAGMALIAAGLFTAFVTKFKLDDDIVKGLPYLATLVVLTIFSRRLRPPAAAGIPWRKGQTT